MPMSIYDVIKKRNPSFLLFNNNNLGSKNGFNFLINNISRNTNLVFLLELVLHEESSFYFLMR